MAPSRQPQILASSAGRGWPALDAELVHVPPGLARVPGGALHRLGMHFGPPVHADCSLAGQRMRRVQKPGDIDVIPAGVDGSWQDDAACQILRLHLRPTRLAQIAEALGKPVDLRPRLQLRDARIEAIGWAIKADLEADAPSDPLYNDGLTNALAVRLIELAGEPLATGERHAPRLSTRQLARLVDFIESHLDHKLALAELATVAGVSVTRLKTLFRNRTGTTVHQYVIRRRVEYARALLTTTAMPASQIALAAGFAHQSHMATTMRRVLGHLPSDLARRES